MSAEFKAKFSAAYTGLNVRSKDALAQSTVFYVVRLVAALTMAGQFPFWFQLHVTITVLFI